MERFVIIIALVAVLAICGCGLLYGPDCDIGWHSIAQPLNACTNPMRRP